MSEVDFIVVGGGLAGSVLSYQLSEREHSVLLISEEGIPSASRVAGGLFNPVTGKYLDKTWLVDKIFDFFEKFYPEAETKLNSYFYHSTGLFRPFTGDEHKVSALAQIEKYNLHDFIEVKDSAQEYSEFYHSEMGGMYTKRAGWLDTVKFLDAVKSYLNNKGQYLNETFDYSKLLILDNTSLSYKGIFAHKIIFCEGYYVKENPYFSWIPLNPAKGEILDGRIEDYNISTIVNQGKWIIPLGNGKVRLGATYTWDELDFETNEKDEKILVETAEKILKRPFVVEGRHAGVRPSTYDRRPIIGRHPKQENLYTFNGLGTKGISLVPYFAAQLIENMLNGKHINAEANIERFYTLYS